MFKEIVSERPNFKPFRYDKDTYDKGPYMCPEGQRTAASEAWDLLSPGGEKGKERMLQRAVYAEGRLRTGAGVKHSQYISYVVIELFCKGRLEEYADGAGNYTLREKDKKLTNRNIFDDMERLRSFWPF